MDELKPDPDYESYNSSVKLHKEEDQKENADKLRHILEEEYNKELVLRQEQIIKIELQICKFRKLLSLLRYVLVTSYYKRPELEYNESDDTGFTSNSSITVPDQQNRIHPAVKKLLGKNVKHLDSYLGLTDKRKSQSRKYIESPPNKKLKLSNPDISEPIVASSNLVTVNNVAKSVVTPAVVETETIQDDVRNRKKSKHRLVIGNTSKWMPSSENDALTHKWMMYVRGSKEQPDVSHIIDQVVFYLHPSYKPHDVVKVCESPFHLCRRGWGEFPVRVKIHFKMPINKPIDVIHNIKLDLKYTGRQTLGNETVLDVFLYDSSSNSSNSIEHVKNETLEIAESSRESDVNVQNSIPEEVEEIQPTDHLYCRPLSEQNVPRTKPDQVEQDESNHLIYGLDKSYTETSNSNNNKLNTFVKIGTSGNMKNTTLIPMNALKQFLQQSRKDGKFNNAKIIVVTNVNKLSGSSIGQNLKVTMPYNRFKNMGEALPYVFHKLPLFTELAANLNYKRMYPFTATSLKQYLGWNIGKQRSSEWSRARAVLKIISLANIHGVDKWNTKSILMYGRSHDFTPNTSYGLFNRESDEKMLLLNCFRDSIEKNNTGIHTPSNDITVDVDSDIDTNNDTKSTGNTTKPLVDISDPNLRQQCSYIRQTALDSGIILKSEEIEEGIVFNGAERMLLASVKCLADNLLRRANNHKICTTSDLNGIVSKNDVEAAMRERPELISIWKFKNKRRNIEYFS